MLDKKEKEKIIEKYRLSDSDTGSLDAQIGILSERIKQLLSHLKEHPKDLHSKRGLLTMVAKRRKFLRLLKKEDEKRYEEVIKKTGLKRKKSVKA